MKTLAIVIALATGIALLTDLTAAADGPGTIAGIDSAGAQGSPGGHGAAGAVSALQIPPDKAAKLIGDIDASLARIDRSQFDIESLLDKLDYDGESIIRFVREDIAYEDYVGVLRGAEGTLRSRAGNSVDQAVLLAKLLNDSGLEARIVEGSVPRGKLGKLVLQPRPKLPGLYQSSGVAEQVKNSEPIAPVFTLPVEVSDVADRLISALRNKGVNLAAELPADSEETVPYFWVEYRDMPSSPWLAVHPVASAENAVLATLRPVNYFAHEIPEEFQQRISVQAFIDRSWGGKIETVAVTEPLEYPAANLSGVTFKYSVIPNVDLGAAAGNGAEAGKLVSKANLFFPVFDFGTPVSGMAFDTMGNTLSPEDASSDKAALFQTVGGRFGMVADALGAGNAEKSGDPRPARYVARHWLQIIIRRPGLAPKIISRDIARWQGGEADFKQSLARTVFFRVETGAVSPAGFLDRNLNGLRQSIVSISAAGLKPKSDDRALRFSMDAEVFLYTSDMISRRDKGLIIYRDEPTIVARYFPYARIDERREGFDIVSAPRHVMSASNGQRDREGALLVGVTDTWLEHKLFAGESWRRGSAFEKLRRQMDSNQPLTLLGGNDADAVGRIPEPGRAFIQQDLDNRDLVLFPGESKTCDAWWRVDPLTGATLGMLENGWGGVEDSEYLANLTIMYGKSKVTVAVLSCSSVIAFIKASAVLSAYSVFSLDEAAGFQGYDVCSWLPPDLQALCTVTMVAAAAAAESGVKEISAETLKYMCLKAIF